MRVNNYSGIPILVAVLLFAIGIAGCDSVTFFPSSVSGVLSVPVTGTQHYEENEPESDFGNDFDGADGAKEIEYEDTAHGTIGTSVDEDYFKFSGTTGDSVIIDIDAEALGSGLDSRLYLFNPSQIEIYNNDDYPPGWQDDPTNYIFALDSHIETTLSTSGTHYIKVEGYPPTTGAYRLNLFQYESGAASADAGTSPPNADFVEDEIIVKYVPGFDPESAKAVTPAGYRPVKTTRDAGSGALSLFKRAEEEKVQKGLSTVRERTLAEAARLSRLPYVEYAEPNYIMRPTFVPDDPYYDEEELQWHYPLIRLDQVWYENLVNNASGVRVAVIDTGIGRSNGTSLGADHPDLAGIFSDEYDFISDPANALDGDGIDPDATDPGDDPSGQFSSFHGTHVIGTIGAVTNNDTGIAGVAGGNSSGVKILPLRALGAQGGSVYDIAQAVRYAAGLANDSETTPSERADIINMSLGAAANSQTLKNSVDAAYGEGVLIVAAAGNEGSSTPFYPAAYDNVVSVSAVGPGNELAPYSSFGATVEIAAPGGDTSTDLTFDVYPDGVLSTLFDQKVSSYSPGYAFYQGTSMAAPHVSGVCALILAANGEDLGPSEIRNILSSTAIDLGQPGKDIYYGHGLVNAYAAVKAALDESQNPVLYPFPRALKLEGTNPVGRFTLKNIGGSGTIQVNNIVEINDPEGFVTSITPESGFPLYVDDTGKWVDISTNTVEDDKTHHARLEITYDDPSKTEYVYVLYNRDGITSFYENEDVGYVFVVAIDPVSSHTVAQDVTSYGRGYSYTISGLPAGDYVIIAGTDRDSDLEICDPGEACGFYPLYGSFTPIEVGEGTVVSGIDFQVIDNVSQGPGSLGITMAIGRSGHPFGVSAH